MLQIFLGNLGKHLGNFLAQHLVTLLTTRSQKRLWAQLQQVSLQRFDENAHVNRPQNIDLAVSRL